MNMGIGSLDDMCLQSVGVGIGVPVDTAQDIVVENNAPVEMSSIEIPTIEELLSTFKSGIGLDIAKNHTGVALWRDGKLETLGFAIDMDDSDSYLSEAKMRLSFKNKLLEILQGYNWEVCVVEDVYGGVNFDTTRKLLALNCVVDELMLEGKVHIDNIYRLKESEWMKNFRTLYKTGSKLNPKYECQLILEHLRFPLVLENKNATNKHKEEIFYEDRCDATGQLLSLVMHLKSNKHSVKQSSVRLSNFKVIFVEDLDDAYYSNDVVLANTEYFFYQNFNTRNIEDGILSMMRENPTHVMVAILKTSDLGTFGLKYGFEFFEQGYGYLIVYDKAIRKEYTEFM